MKISNSPSYLLGSFYLSGQKREISQIDLVPACPNEICIVKFITPTKSKNLSNCKILWDKIFPPDGESFMVENREDSILFVVSGLKTLIFNIFYCHTGLVLMNAIATQDCIHDPTFRHSSPSVFIRGDRMLKTQGPIYSTT